MSLLNGQTLFSGVGMNLSSTYSTLLSSISKSGTGLSLKDLSGTLNASTLTALGGNTVFLSYLKNNFANLDIDGDGEITAKDMDTTINNMQTQGMTYSEIQQLCQNSGNSTLYNTVLEYFNQIDTNGDGKVTSAEITAFNYKCDRFRVEQKYQSYRAANASLYYNDGVENDTTSVLDSMVPNMNQTNNNNN